MLKCACVFSFKKSNWISCQQIVFNLHKAYEIQSGVQIENFNLSKEFEIKEIKQLAFEIFQARPEAIVFLDHQPNPILLIIFLIKFYEDQHFPKFIFHIFGDFSLEYVKWGKIGDLLKGANIDFIVPSPRQKLYFDQFLTKSNHSSICHFPVNEDEFNYRPDLRPAQREEWKVKENEKVFIFTGRLSRQKRIHTLIKAFAQSYDPKQRSHLLLYGNPDSISDPFLGRCEAEGEYFRAIHKLYAKLPRPVRNCVHFMGSVSQSELLPVYQGADALLNLSVHNDEDFGMSVAEAQFCGLPAILTRWGGLAAFSYPELQKATHFLPVSIGEKSKIISLQKTVSSLKGFTPLLEDERKQLSKLALNKFGIKSASSLIETNLSTKINAFAGFNPFFDKVSQHVTQNRGHFLTEAKKINSLYKNVYGVYA